MSKALKNKQKLNDAVDVVADFGADPTGATFSDAAFASARAVTNRYFIPAGTYKLSGAPDPFLD